MTFEEHKERYDRAATEFMQAKFRAAQAEKDYKAEEENFIGFIGEQKPAVAAADLKFVFKMFLQSHKQDAWLEFKRRQEADKHAREARESYIKSHTEEKQ